MTGQADLSGCTILVVENEFYLAIEMESTLRQVGGMVIGPVGHEDQALELLAQATPRCAMVDIDLGDGARFVVSDALQGRGVPFVFVTGYDDTVIPARFKEVERLCKPIEFREVVRATARMCGM